MDREIPSVTFLSGNKFPDGEMPALNHMVFQLGKPYRGDSLFPLIESCSQQKPPFKRGLIVGSRGFGKRINKNGRSLRSGRLGTPCDVERLADVIYTLA
jgi:hypothetical protein